MTQQSFDEMTNLLDEVVNEIIEDDGLALSPVEVSVESVVVIPSSPAKSRSFVLSSPPEIRNSGSLGRVGDTSTNGNRPRESDGLTSRFPGEVDVNGTHTCIEPVAR